MEEIVAPTALNKGVQLELSCLELRRPTDIFGKWGTKIYHTFLRLTVFLVTKFGYLNGYLLTTRIAGALRSFSSALVSFERN